jgi:hypothetical protein
LLLHVLHVTDIFECNAVFRRQEWFLLVKLHCQAEVFC